MIKKNRFKSKEKENGIKNKNLNRGRFLQEKLQMSINIFRKLIIEISQFGHRSNGKTTKIMKF
jgi:hypothetical protein